MSNDAPPVVPDDRTRYDAIRKELLQAIVKKRQTDKHLVRLARNRIFIPTHPV